MNDGPSKEALTRKVAELEAEIRRLKRASGAAEEKYHQVLRHIEEGYLELDLKGSVLAFNQAAVVLTGYDAHRLAGRNYRQYTTTATANRMLEVFQRIHRTGHPERMINCEVIHKDGAHKVHDMSAGLMRDDTDAPVGFQLIVHDVTTRRHSESLLKAGEARYRAIFENTGNATILIAGDTTILLANSNFERLTGYRKIEMEGKMSWTVFIHPQDLERMKRYHFARRDPTDSAPNFYEFRLLNRDGEIRTIFLTVALIPNSGDSVASCMDITDHKLAQEALRRSEERFRTILDSMDQAYFECDLGGNYVYVNEAQCKIMGYTRKKLLGMNHRDCTSPETGRRAYNVFNEIYRTGRQRSIADYEIIRKDGKKIIAELSASLLLGKAGEVIGFRGLGRDVTQKIEAEKALKASEERYRTIFENTATANIIVSEDTTILLANSNFERIIGYSREEVENKMSWTDFIVEEDLAIMKQRHIQRRNDPGAVPGNYDFKARIRSGEVRDFYMSVAMIPETNESVASFIDITDRKQAQEAFRQSQERFRDLARLLPETVFETNAEGQLTFVNEISLERFGYTQEEVDKGIHILDVMAPEDHERGFTNFMRVMAGEKLGLSEYTALKKDGTRFPALIHSTPIHRNGDYVGLRGFLIDITEKKQLEEQLIRSEKMEAIGTLAGGIAHDFNNLLMGILGNITLILMQLDESHPFHDRLKNMETYVQHGADLTRQLLGFARGGKYEVKSTDPGAFVLNSAQLFGRTKKEIRMHCKVDEGIWSVEVDQGQMEQVMLNLFVNAWQAMPGGGDLYLSVENVALGRDAAARHDIHPGRYVKITVTDTGEGMEETTIARIFEPFFSTKQRGRGTGLGLSSAYGIIKNHGGFVLVESEKKVGTSFMVYLPASTKQVKPALPAVVPIVKGRETVLLIDDEEMILNVGAKMLESLGYAVITAHSGSQGIELFDRNKGAVDLVILDMIMPDLGGRDTFEHLRRSKPEVKVLLASGYSIDGQAEEIMARGCKGFIQKPFTMAELSRRVRAILESP